MNKINVFALFSLVAMLWGCGSVPGEDTAEAENKCYEDSVSYEADVKPIFEANCFSCHNEEKYASKADGNKMYTYEHIKGKIDEGLVLGNIKHLPGYINMPYKKEKIDSCSIAIIERWIKTGYKKN